MATTMTREPIRLDRLMGYAGRATRRAAPGPLKRYARVVGVSVSRACRHRQGDPHSPAVKALEYIDTLARGAGTSPWPQIAEEIAVAKQAQIEGAPTPALVRRWWEITREEHTHEAHENDATVRGDLAALADADVREAELQLERAAISRELAERGVDPRDAEWAQVCTDVYGREGGRRAS